jgi:hypothetical protein
MRFRSLSRAFGDYLISTSGSHPRAYASTRLAGSHLALIREAERSTFRVAFSNHKLKFEL